MENYINATEAYLGMIQSTMSDEEFKRSTKAGEEMYEEIKKITAKHNLNITEMLNSTLAIHMTILEVCNEQIEEMKSSDEE
jgi:hypothetical protein